MMCRATALAWYLSFIIAHGIIFLVGGWWIWNAESYFPKPEERKKEHRENDEKKYEIAMIIIETRFGNFRCFLGEYWYSWTSLIFAWLFFFSFLFCFDFISRMFYFMQIWLAVALFFLFLLVDYRNWKNQLIWTIRPYKGRKEHGKQYKRISLWAYSIKFILGIF